MEIEELKKLCFGPVPSRRLGRSLGINNIPSKICSYACVYCQLGKTLHNQIHRIPFYDVEDILMSVQIRLDSLKNKNETIDYLAYVPDGEPTLDANLGKEVDRLKQFGIKTAIISNASLIGSAEVCNDLCKFDWVSLKIDAVSEDIWHKINRPNKELILQEIQQGTIDFRSEFSGFFATETMVIKGLNDTEEELTKIALFLQKVKPNKSYISIPTRPPAEGWVTLPDEQTLTMAYQIFTEHGIDTELITGYEGDSFTLTEDPVSDILSITSVHPMRREAVDALLQKAHAHWSIIEGLIQSGVLIETEYNRHLYYARKLSR